MSTISANYSLDLSGERSARKETAGTAADAFGLGLPGTASSVTDDTVTTDVSNYIKAHKLSLVALTPDLLAEFELFKQNADAAVAAGGTDPIADADPTQPPVGYSLELPAGDSPDWVFTTDADGVNHQSLSPTSLWMTRTAALLYHAGEDAEQAARSEKTLQAWLRDLLGRQPQLDPAEDAADAA